jgi:hypothetical protein
MSKRWLFWAALVVLMALAGMTAACGSDNGGAVRVKVRAGKY